MKEIIKKIYEGNIEEDIKLYNFTDYYYFVDNDNNIFGISKNKITDNEMKLISGMFHQLSPGEIYNDKSNVIDYLFGKKTSSSITSIKYYFIKLFKVQDEEINTEIFNLLTSTFEEAYVTKRDNIYIIIVEKNEEFNFLELLQSIETDFLIKLIGFESDFYENNPLLSNFFQLDFTNIKEYHQANRLLLNKVHLLTNKILENIDYENRKIIKQYILKEFLFDQEMKKIIKMYFESNFNSSLAAKNCYMHRNTFLNKLEKFSSSTNFNFKNYDEAFIIYMAIIM